MSFTIQITGAHLAYAGMAAAGVGTAVFATPRATQAVGDRYLAQLLVDPMEVLAHKDGMVLERKRQSHGDSAALSAVLGGVVLGATGGLLMLGGTGPSQASAGAFQLVRGLGGAGLVGAGIGVAAGGLIAHRHYAGAQMRPQ